MKKVFSKVLSVLLVGILAVSGTTAFAVEHDVTSSTASIELVSGGLIIVDPEDPDFPTIEGRDMHFGAHQITGTTQRYATVGEEPVGVLIADARGGTEAEWFVNVTIDQFGKAEDPLEQTLQGFSLKLASIPSSVVGPNASPSNVPSMKDVTLTEGSTHLLFESNRTGGSAGKWGANWSPELTVIGGTETMDTHVATITWAVVSAV